MMHDDYFMAAADNVYNVFFHSRVSHPGRRVPIRLQVDFPWVLQHKYPDLHQRVAGRLHCNAALSALDRHEMPYRRGGGNEQPVLFASDHQRHSAWNTMGFALTSAIYVMAAFFCGWSGTKRGIACSTALITCSLATYQLMMPLPMCMTIMLFVHKAVVHRQWEWKRAFSVALAMALATAIYLVYVVVLSPMIFGPYEGAGIKSLSQVWADRDALITQTKDLYLNLFYTPFSFYAGVKPALSLWYYAPLTIAGIGLAVVTVGVYKRRIGFLTAPVLLGCWLGLPFLAIVPLWFIPLYTEWRISFIVLITQVIALGSIAATIQQLAARTSTEATSDRGETVVAKPVRWGLPAIIALLAILMIPITVTDCKMRLDDYRHDRRIVESIRAFRNSLQDAAKDHRVAYLAANRDTLTLEGDEPALMKANYVINTYSTFSYGKIWAYAMFRWYDLDSITEKELNGVALPEDATLVEQERIRFGVLPYVRHYREQKLSVVVGSPQWSTWRVAK